MSSIAKAIRESKELLTTYSVEHPPVDVHLLIEKEGLSIVEKELEDRVSGFLLQAPTGTVIGVNSLHHRNRQRFTLAHELGHHRLHPDQPTIYVDDVLVHFRGEDIHAPLTPAEVEANAFAASLLMPEDFIKRDLAGRSIDTNDDEAVRQLARRYQVSAQALTIRLVDLGMLRGLMAEPRVGRKRPLPR